MNTRQQDIISLLEVRGEITIKELSDIFHVTEMTIHRDLDYLSENKFLYKKRGAAVYIEKSDRKRTEFYCDEKRMVGKKLVEFIKPGQSIIFDNSTTGFEGARFLKGIPNLTFYTTNIETTMLLAGYHDCLLYCSGGYYFNDSKGFLGKQTESFVENVKADICIIGASGISVSHGITNPYPMHSTLQRKIIDCAKFKILLVDHSKFGKVAAERVCDLNEIDLIITDSGMDEKILREYEKYTKIIIAD